LVLTNTNSTNPLKGGGLFQFLISYISGGVLYPPQVKQAIPISHFRKPAKTYVKSKIILLCKNKIKIYSCHKLYIMSLIL
jgi:hypothetical protein